MSELAFNPVFPAIPAPRTGVWVSVARFFFTADTSPAVHREAPQRVARRRSGFLDDARMRREMYRD